MELLTPVHSFIEQHIRGTRCYCKEQEPRSYSSVSYSINRWMPLICIWGQTRRSFWSSVYIKAKCPWIPIYPESSSLGMKFKQAGWGLILSRDKAQELQQMQMTVQMIGSAYLC